MTDPYLVAQYASEGLNTRRKEQNLTREEVVDRLAVLLATPIKPRTLGSWVHGTRTPSFPQFVAWCDALEVSDSAVLHEARLRAGLNNRCECCGQVRGVIVDG